MLLELREATYLVDLFESPRNEQPKKDSWLTLTDSQKTFSEGYQAGQFNVLTHGAESCPLAFGKFRAGGRKTLSRALLVTTRNDQFARNKCSTVMTSWFQQWFKGNPSRFRRFVGIPRPTKHLYRVAGFIYAGASADSKHASIGEPIHSQCQPSHIQWFAFIPPFIKGKNMKCLCQYTGYHNQVKMWTSSLLFSLSDCNENNYISFGHHILGMYCKSVLSTGVYMLAGNQFGVGHKFTCSYFKFPPRVQNNHPRVPGSTSWTSWADPPDQFDWFHEAQ